MIEIRGIKEEPNSILTSVRVDGLSLIFTNDPKAKGILELIQTMKWIEMSSMPLTNQCMQMSHYPNEDGEQPEAECFINQYQPDVQEKRQGEAGK